jgi:hypothetical protein
VYLEDQEDIKKLEEVMQIYEEGTGAEINFSKSKALPLGTL